MMSIKSMAIVWKYDNLPHMSIHIVLYYVMANAIQKGFFYNAKKYRWHKELRLSVHPKASSNTITSHQQRYSKFWAKSGQSGYIERSSHRAADFTTFKSSGQHWRC